MKEAADQDKAEVVSVVRFEAFFYAGHIMWAVFSVWSENESNFCLFG